MGDGETPTVAEERALLEAKRTAIEQAGTYIQSYSAVKNFQLTDDEVKTLASGIMQVTVLDKRRTVVGDGINFWVKIKAEVSTDNIETMAKEVKEKSNLEDYQRLQAEYDQSQQQIADLKKQLQAARNDQERQQIRDRIAYNDNLFQARVWFERGNRHAIRRDYEQALEAYNRAIAINPQYGYAYVNRGRVYALMGRFRPALDDYNTALEINPGLVRAYLLEGRAYEHMGRNREAIESYRSFIRYAPDRERLNVEQARRRIRFLERW
ncbi:Hypothetical protein LUCI_0418 [Lucifera butyrica]|uniref:Uncharacterized protein n=2 Tax=Lucifera butyrica TaxID=1351585 RepID=A0A498R1I7_9FIRM|nr:Hypothetical protein LUCI_0418 [Lucifera butyrica]